MADQAVMCNFCCGMLPERRPILKPANPKIARQASLERYHKRQAQKKADELFAKKKETEMSDQTSSNQPRKGLPFWVYFIAIVLTIAMGVGIFVLGRSLPASAPTTPAASSPQIVVVTATPNLDDLVNQAVQKTLEAQAPKVVVTPPAPKVEAPTPAPTAVLSNKTCQGLCWTIDQVNKKLVGTFPTDGREDVWLADEFLDLVRQGYSVEFGPQSVPGILEICHGDVKIDGTTLDYSQGKCTSTLSVSKGKFEVSNSVGTSGGMRWKPAKGYGWNK